MKGWEDFVLEYSLYVKTEDVGNVVFSFATYYVPEFILANVQHL